MFAKFETLLNRTIGLDVASIGSADLERAVESRRAACSLKDVPAYWARLCASGAELQELIEEVIVPETWFFRDKEAFAAVGRMVSEDWLRTHPTGLLRLLSLPCSTGEEPYSLVMALLEAGCPVGRFRVDAVDISHRALARAKRAVYGKHSFRGTDLGFCDRHFEAKARAYHLAAAVREQVHFHHGNLLDEALLSGAELYDVIFCRNVLIYFDRATQHRVINVLTRLLAATGTLFVGPSEAGLLLSRDFTSARVPLAFAFRKPAPHPREPTRHAASSPRLAAVVPPPVFFPHPPTGQRVSAAKAVTTHPGPLAAPPVKPLLGLDEAARLADQGRLTEAATHCEDHLQAHGPSAKAFYLLALVRDAAGNQPEAAECYRKALYLDPKHLEALVHFAFLLEKQGDKGGAKVLNDRARRVAQKHPA